MSEEIKVSEEARNAAQAECLESFRHQGNANPLKAECGYYIQLLLNQRDTKIAALEAEFHNSCEAHGMRVGNLLQIIEERNSALERLEAEVGELKDELSKTEFGDKHSYDQRYHCFSCLGLKPVHHEKCNFTKLMHDHNTALNSTKGEK